jgi:hypothetical protein
MRRRYLPTKGVVFFLISKRLAKLLRFIPSFLFILAFDTGLLGGTRQKINHNKDAQEICGDEGSLFGIVVLTSKSLTGKLLFFPSP